MKDSLDALELPLTPDRWVWAWMGTLGAASGALAGGIEALGLSLRLELEMSLAESVTLVGATVILDGLLGLGAGLAAGLVAQVVGGRWRRWKRYAAGFTLATALLALFFLAPLARELWMQERRDAAAGMLALAAMIAILAWYNAAYWFRRCLIGAGPGIGWRVIAPLAGLALGLVGAAIGGPSEPRAPVAAPELPNLILFTVDTMRRDHVGLYGSLVSTPRIDTLGREGVIFDDAVTPLPETLPAHTSMLTGLQPSQTGILSNGAVLKGGYQTVTEQLAAAGYRTGAFVSSFAVDADTGVHQGFQVFDDDFFPFLRGVTQLRAASVALPLLMRFGDPAKYPFLLERGTPETIRRALAWIDGHDDDRPFFLWVHIFDPHSPYEPRDGSVATVDHRAILPLEPGYPYNDEERAALKDYYRQECEYSDQQVGALFDALRERSELDRAMFVVTADHGESLGEHGINFTHHGIYDSVLRVPLVVWANPPVMATTGPVPPGTRVSRMVNVADIANTLLEFTGLPLLSGTPSVPLLAHVRGGDVPGHALALTGREGASLTDGQLCGARDPKGIKYIRHQDGREEFYDLTADPGELVDIAASQPAGVQAGRQAVEGCVGAAAAAPAPDMDRDECERLKAMGYISGDCE